MIGSSFFNEIIKFVVLNKESYVRSWKYLNGGKTETIYLVALSTLNASLDHDAGLEVSRYRNLRKISTCRLRYILCVVWVMMQVFN